MSRAYELATYLASVGGLGLTLGTNLFVSSEPASPADCVTLYDTGGPPPYQDFDGDTWIAHPTVQVRVRNGEYLAGNTLIGGIRDALKTIVHTSLSGTRYGGVFIASEPTHLGKITTNAGTANVWTMNVNLNVEEE